MKVFTHYTNLKSENDGIRWRTILKFGNSWEIKGSVVMKNPGAANFKRPDHAAIDSPEELKQLSVFDDGEIKADWYEFSSDPTIECIGRLFSEYYATKGEQLKGVIQIFNLFYLREADLATALDKVQQMDIANMLDYDINHLSSPVYLGFADLACHKKYGVAARRFFDAAKNLGASYLNDDFNKNAFIHPLYLMMYGKNKEKCIRAKFQFFQNTLTPVVSKEMNESATAPIAKLDIKAIMMKITTTLNGQLSLVKGEEKNHRYIFDDLIELTVTDKEQGFVGFRHLRNGKSYYNYTNQEAPNEYFYRDVLLKEFGFDTEKYSGKIIWLARKAFKDYGSNEQDIIDNILEEINNLRNRLKSQNQLDGNAN